MTNLWAEAESQVAGLVDPTVGLLTVGFGLVIAFVVWGLIKKGTKSAARA